MKTRGNGIDQEALLWRKDKFADRHFLFIFHPNLLRFCFLVWYCQFDVSPVNCSDSELYTYNVCRCNKSQFNTYKSACM